MGEISGTMLKADPGDTDQGIFFISGDGTEFRVETLIRNKPANLIFMIPGDLGRGEHEVWVRSKVRNGDTIRTGRLNATLVVP